MGFVVCLSDRCLSDQSLVAVSENLYITVALLCCHLSGKLCHYTGMRLGIGGFVFLLVSFCKQSEMSTSCSELTFCTNVIQIPMFVCFFCFVFITSQDFSPCLNNNILVTFLFFILFFI